MIVHPPALNAQYLSDDLRANAKRAPSEARSFRAETLSELHRNIQDVFNEYGVQIMSPHYRGDPAVPKVVPPGQWSPAPAKPPTKG